MEKTNDISLTHKNIKASEIIRKKISDHGGAVTIGLLSGKTCDIYITPDKSSFSSTKLHNFIYDFCVFDIVVDLLIRQGGKAKKETHMEKMIKSDRADALRTLLWAL